MVSFALVENLATCIDYKFGHQVAQLGLVQNLVLMWRHLDCLQSWPPVCITAVPHCLELPYWHYQLVLSWYLHQPESHQLSVKKWRTDGLTSDDLDPKIGPQGHDQLVIVPWRDPFIRLLLQHHPLYHTTVVKGRVSQNIFFLRRSHWS